MHTFNYHITTLLLNGLRDYGLEPVYWPSVTFSPMAGLPPLYVPEQVCCLGLEGDIWSYVGHLVAVFREVKRVGRDDSTLWINLGDSYQSNNSPQVAPGGIVGQPGMRKSNPTRPPVVPGLKPKDLMGIPWRVAYALQADGWWLRSDIIWAKPNPMPESVTDRPTKAHEYVFLLSKGEKYFYDAEAVREPHVRLWDSKTNGGSMATERHHDAHIGGTNRHARPYPEPNPAGRNRRTVWTIATQAYSAAHFATFPPKLIEPMILASTSQEGVCGECGNPWRRVVEKVKGEDMSYNGSSFNKGKTKEAREHLSAVGEGERTAATVTTGWQPSCTHNAPIVPAVILDPFIGSGTVGQVAIKHRRNYIGIEANPAYGEGLVGDRLDGVQIVMGLES